jgi:hypothetical protein
LVFATGIAAAGLLHNATVSQTLSSLRNDPVHENAPVGSIVECAVTTACETCSKMITIPGVGSKP